MKYSFYSLIIIIFFASACKKKEIEAPQPVDKFDTTFVGIWYDNGFTTLNINADQTGTYNYNSGFFFKTIDGKVHAFNDILSIGTTISERFVINTYPTTDSLETYMILDSVKFEKL